MPIAKEAFLPSVEPAEDSIALGHTDSKIAVILLKNWSFKSIETKTGVLISNTALHFINNSGNSRHSNCHPYVAREYFLFLQENAFR